MGSSHTFTWWPMDTGLHPVGGPEMWSSTERDTSVTHTEKGARGCGKWQISNHPQSSNQSSLNLPNSLLQAQLKGKQREDTRI